ncbi:MotA/TolQ/ExbB proton channel family protein [Tundrisphaera lichenicola]|uniref:MotA/TolQ/ExbB proton channel family protein n=1 Tax=Tundrisphaera lichenicola TaxID=2029860 RepID=UPI003EB851D3
MANGRSGEGLAEPSLRTRILDLGVVAARCFGRRARLVLLVALMMTASVPAQEPGRISEPDSPTASARLESAPPPPSSKASDPGAKAAAGGVGRRSILVLFGQANPMLWLLGICSIVTVGYTLERMIGLRRGRVIPKDFVNRFLERLSAGKLDRDRAMELCRSNESPMARVFGHVVRYWGQPASTIRQAVDHDSAREILDLRRNVRVLNGTATLAPLLGLLGTVIGMIQSFDAIGSKVGGGKSEALAQGISLALVCTAIGLGIAVASVVAYYYLLNRVDLLVRDMDDLTRRVIDQVSGEALRPVDRRVDHVRNESRVY